MMMMMMVVVVVVENDLTCVQSPVGDFSQEEEEEDRLKEQMNSY